MSKFFLDEDISARDEAVKLLAFNAIPYIEDEDGYRFVLAQGSYRWEVKLCCQDEWVAVYSILPVQLEETAALAALLNEINGQLLSGAVFLQEGRAVIRTGVQLFDVYAAYEAIALALEYNASAVTGFWNRIAAYGGECPRT